MSFRSAYPWRGFWTRLAKISRTGSESGLGGSSLACPPSGRSSTCRMTTYYAPVPSLSTIVFRKLLFFKDDESLFEIRLEPRLFAFLEERLAGFRRRTRGASRHRSVIRTIAPEARPRQERILQTIA